MTKELKYYQIFWNKEGTNTFEYRYKSELEKLLKNKDIHSYCLIEYDDGEFDNRFGKLYTLKQLEDVKKKGGNWKPYPANEEIKQFYNDKISKIIKKTL